MFGACLLLQLGRLPDLAWLADRLDPRLEGQTLELAGVVTSVPERSGADLRFIVRSADIRLGDKALRDAPGSSALPSRIELTWYGGKRGR